MGGVERESGSSRVRPWEGGKWVLIRRRGRRGRGPVRDAARRPCSSVASLTSTWGRPGSDEVAILAENSGCSISGEVRQAVEAFERCLVLRRKTRNKIGLAEALNKLGLTYCDIGWVYAGWSWVCCVASGFVRWCGSVGIQFLKRQGAGKQASWCWQRGNWEGSRFRLGTRSHV